MENFLMLEDYPFSNILCDICGKDVEILNNDLTFSRELHNQSHKKLSDVNLLIPGSREKTEKNLDTVQNHSQNYYCATCNKYFEIFNNDFELSLQLHTQNHELNNEIQNKGTLASNDTSSLDKTFNTFSPGLKCHRYFVSELDDNNAFCKVCNLEVGNILSISNHLKTKLHEDNTILLLKQKLPSSLHYEMEFVSFFGSRLYCNLCNSIIILCSNNIHETVLNIIAHNSCETHLKYNTDNDSQEEYNEASSVLKDLAKYEHSKIKNKSHIDYKMVPQFRCNLCNTNIAYDENKTKMMNNLTNHLQNSTHRKLHNALVIEEFELDYIPSDVKHKFISKDDGVLCSACNIMVKEKIGDLISHMKQNNCLEKLNESVDLNQQLCDAFKNENNLEKYYVSKKLYKILNTLPKTLDTFCIKKNELGQVVCIVCNCTMTSNSNIKLHLSGKRHKNNTEKRVVNSLFENIPENLQGNKSFFKTIAVDKSHVLCNKCNVKIPAQHNNLLEHLQVASHITKPIPIEVQSKNDDRYGIAKLSELQRTKSCEEVISKNDLVEQVSLFSLKMSSEISELKRILDDLLEQVDTSCIMVNEMGEITCIICNCPVNLNKNDIKQHLAGLRHKENENKRVVDGLFENIPEYLKWNKSFINIRVGDKSNVFCSKCNVKISAHHKCLFEHLQGASHIRVFSKPIEGQSKKDVKPEIAKLPELQQTKTCAGVISKNGLVQQFSLMSIKVSPKASELKCILDDIPKQYQTSCIQMNEKGEIICVTCNCPVHVHKDMIKKHLSGIRHKKNEKKKIINPLFKNIPKKLNCDKSVIQVLAGDKSNVFCSKCNVKILANRNSMLEHLQGDKHSTLLGRRQQVNTEITTFVVNMPETVLHTTI